MSAISKAPNCRRRPQNLKFDENGEPRQDTISFSIGATKFYHIPASKDITDLSKLLHKNGFNKDIDWDNAKIEIHRSKTPAGWRTPSLNQTCLEALRSLFD